MNIPIITNTILKYDFWLDAPMANEFHIYKSSFIESAPESRLRIPNDVCTVAWSLLCSIGRRYFDKGKKFPFDN